jgi:hypothetical protein
MDVYVFNADIYCADCGREMIDECRERGIVDDGDSDQFPQGPYPNGGGESDTPQHCGECGVFLRNPLTSDGADHVREQHAVHPSKVTREWLDFYDIEPAKPRRTIHRTYDDWLTDSGE